ncbi:anti-sigma factor family protein [Brevibacillus ginsengisoli]|uniref:anti-sigma factor family protein n=1 Tax=Brevibacillus ginsengisoli TaxID=363854 RepID=UPI003CF1817E
MLHIDELTMMMYIDHELSSEENLKVASHLVDCPGCQLLLAHWQAEQSFFQHSFATQFHVQEIELSASTLHQINEIAQLHKQSNRRFTYRFTLLFSFVTGALVYLAFFFQGWMFRWIESIWDMWQHSVIWVSTFWIKEKAGSLLDLPDIYTVSTLFIFLLSCLLFLNIYKDPYQHWNESKGVLKK